MSTPRTKKRARTPRAPRVRLLQRRFGLDPETDRLLTIKARAHGVSRAAFVRAAINGSRPGAEPGSLAAAADQWWDSRTPTRRAAIYRNHANAAAEQEVPADQLTIFDAEETE
jgi:hypothetical protein